ncbi:hypothetical protein BT93_D1865 [Corymbia citriodora subsp. variegata]|nr:hypothetical protein BT93_D1865 [Corymbia citriodora subsp. variegata]
MEDHRLLTFQRRSLTFCLFPVVPRHCLLHPRYVTPALVEVNGVTDWHDPDRPRTAPRCEIARPDRPIALKASIRSSRTCKKHDSLLHHQNSISFFLCLFPGDGCLHYRLAREEDMDGRRKREDGGEATGGKKRAKGPESAAAREQAAGEVAVAAATEEEVEEFYAILRRIHAAVKYFEKGKKGEGSRRLTLSELEALPEDDGTPPRGRRSDDLALDLNSEPSSEANVASGS